MKIRLTKRSHKDMIYYLKSMNKEQKIINRLYIA
jgi:hypothetical protein